MSATYESLGTLTDRTLAWMSQQGTTGLIRTVVQDAIRSSHDKRCSQENWSFLQWPRAVTIPLVAGQVLYTLHERFQVPRTMVLGSTGQPVAELADGALLEYGATPTATGSPDGFAYVGRAPVQTQPTTPGTVTLTSSGVDTARAWTIEGETAAGVFVSETLTGPATTATSFALITGFRKHDGPDTPWAGTLTLTCGADTLLTLSPTEFGKSYRQIALNRIPSAADTLVYTFYRQPNALAHDGAVPDIPPPFGHLLVFDALILLAGFNRATAPELRAWERQRDELELALGQTYNNGHTVGAAPQTPAFRR